MSSNPCYSGLRRQTAEGVVRGVAYRPRQRVLLVARLECRLAAGSRPKNGDKRRSLALWAVREFTSHWGLCLLFCANDERLGSNALKTITVTLQLSKQSDSYIYQSIIYLYQTNGPYQR